MNAKAIEQLAVAMQRFAEYKAEVKALDTKASQAQRDLESATKNTALSEKELYRIVSESNATLDMVKIRTPHLRKVGARLFEELRDALKNADRAWSLAVESSAKVIEARFYKATAKFFGGDAEKAKIALAGTFIPGTDWQNRLFLEADIRLTEENIWVVARHFAQHAELYFKDLAIGPDEPNKPATASK